MPINRVVLTINYSQYQALMDCPPLKKTINGDRLTTDVINSLEYQLSECMSLLGNVLSLSQNIMIDSR